MEEFVIISSESFFKKLLNSDAFAISVWDLSGRIVYCNSYFKNKFANSTNSIAENKLISIENDRHKEISNMFSAIENPRSFSIHKNDKFNNSYTIFYDILSFENKDYIKETIIPNNNQAGISIKNEAPELQPNDMILSDKRMKSIIETINRISNFDSTVLITGESGTGKSMLAKYIHSKSKRANEPFVTINCATIPENLIESELFGYVSGAFTGANQKGKPGMVELADKGTLFLDEIGLLPLNLQSKFLQLIQEKTYTPVGAVKSKTADLRIISATNLNLDKQISLNRFREDLYYRLRVIEFYMPPLRERPDAIEPLIDYFINLYNNKYLIEKSISSTAKEMLKHHNWSGNIRELQYLIERLVVTSPDNQIMTSDIPPIININSENSPDGSIEEINFEASVEQFEKKILSHAFFKYKNSYKVADALGITQSKASRLLRKYNIH